MTRPVQAVAPALLSWATTDSSVAESTNVVVAVASRTAIMPRLSQTRRGTVDVSRASSSDCTGGFMTVIAVPAATSPAPTAYIVAVLPIAVTPATARAGPSMYDSSTAIESTANAVRR